MLKLLRLEFLFNLRQLLIVLAVFSAYFGYLVNRLDSPGVFIVSTSLLIGLSIPFTVLGREDKYKTAALVCSLPVRRSIVILSKYVATWAAVAAGLGYALLFSAIFPFSKIQVPEIMTLKTLLISLFLMSLLYAVILPFTVRFGLAGIIVLLVGCQLLGIVALLTAQLLGRGSNPLHAAIGTVENGLRGLLHHESTPGYLLSLLAAVVVVNVLSFYVSRALYARRDL